MVVAILGCHALSSEIKEGSFPLLSELWTLDSLISANPFLRDPEEKFIKMPVLKAPVRGDHSNPWLPKEIANSKSIDEYVIAILANVTRTVEYKSDEEDSIADRAGRGAKFLIDALNGVVTSTDPEIKQAINSATDVMMWLSNDELVGGRNNSISSALDMLLSTDTDASDVEVLNEVLVVNEYITNLILRAYDSGDSIKSTLIAMLSAASYHTVAGYIQDNADTGVEEINRFVGSRTPTTVLLQLSQSIGNEYAAKTLMDGLSHLPGFPEVIDDVAAQLRLSSSAALARASFRRRGGMISLPINNKVREFIQQDINMIGSANIAGVNTVDGARVSSGVNSNIKQTKNDIDNFVEFVKLRKTDGYDRIPEITSELVSRLTAKSFLKELFAAADSNSELIGLIPVLKYESGFRAFIVNGIRIGVLQLANSGASSGGPYGTDGLNSYLKAGIQCLRTGSCKPIISWLTTIVMPVMRNLTDNMYNKMKYGPLEAILVDPSNRDKLIRDSVWLAYCNVLPGAASSGRLNYIHEGFAKSNPSYAVALSTKSKTDFGLSPIGIYDLYFGKGVLRNSGLSGLPISVVMAIELAVHENYTEIAGVHKNGNVIKPMKLSFNW